jgi:hypothetical protein
MARQMLGYPEPDVFFENDSDIEFLGTSPGDGSSKMTICLPAANQPLLFSSSFNY